MAFPEPIHGILPNLLYHQSHLQITLTTHCHNNKQWPRQDGLQGCRGFLIFLFSGALVLPDFQASQMQGTNN